MVMDEQEKRDVEKLTEEKKKPLPWWQRLSPIILGVAGILAFVFISNIMYDIENRNMYIFWLVALIVVLYILGQAPKTKDEEIITPKEAELLTERECERKRRWGQFEPMSTYRIGPTSDLQHRDARGIFYNVAVEVVNPYDKPKYYLAKVYARGLERGFVTLQESIGPMKGREFEQEKSVIPEWLTRSREYPLLEKMILRKRE